jgi:hypothetical protein
VVVGLGLCRLKFGFIHNVAFQLGLVVFQGVIDFPIVRMLGKSEGASFDQLGEMGDSFQASLGILSRMFLEGVLKVVRPTVPGLVKVSISFFFSLLENDGCLQQHKLC